jgi:hypothetical protein
MPLLEPVGVRPIFPPGGDGPQLLTMESLQTLAQHRTITLGHNRTRHFDPQIRANHDDVPVLRRVMDLAQGQPIPCGRRPARV